MCVSGMLVCVVGVLGVVLSVLICEVVSVGVLVVC